MVILYIKNNFFRYELYSYEHPFYLDSRCVRTTFLTHEEANEDINLITNLINQRGFLTRVLGSAVVDEEAKGFDVLYYAYREYN